MKIQLTLLILSAFGFSASAFVPEYGTITSKMADQHGRGAYLVEQEVSCQRGGEINTVKETWLVNGEGNQRLTLEGRGSLKGLVSGTILFENSAKFSIEPGQAVHSSHLGDEWLEPLFYFRSSRWLRHRLVNLHVTASETLKDRPPLKSDGDPGYQTPNFIRLSRTGGAIAWAIGVPPSVGIAPTLWVEQDQFVILKFKGPNQVQLTADDYAKYDDGFWYPRARTYTFGEYTVTFKTLSVKSAGKISTSDKRFQRASLDPKRDGLKLPETEGLREFYQRFR